MNAATPLQRQITVPAQNAPNTGAQIGAALQSVGDVISEFGEQNGRAEIQSSLVSARLEAAKKLDDLTQQYQTDSDPATAPDRFAKDAQKIGDEIGQSLKAPAAVTQFEADFGSLMEGRRVAIKDQSFQRQVSKATADQDALIEQMSRQAAYATNPVERQSATDAIKKSIDGLVSTGMQTAEVGQKKLQTARERIALYDGERAIAKDPRAAVSALEDKNYLSDLDPLTRVQLQDRASSEVRQREREARADAAQARQDVAAQLSDAQQMLEAGIPVDVSTLTPLAHIAASSPTLSSRFDMVLAQVHTFNQLRGADQTDVRKMIGDLEAEAARYPSPVTAAKLISARRYAKSLNDSLNSDMLTWADGQGVVKIAPLSLNGSDSTQAWKDRIAAGDRAATVYGRPADYLTRSERAALHDRLAHATTADDKLAVVTTLINGLGDRAQGEIMALAPKDPVIAQAGALMLANKRSAARDAVVGQALLEAKGAVLAPSKDARTAQVPDVQKAFRFAPQMATQSMQTASAIYAARASAMGFTGDDAVGDGADMYTRAVQESVGAEFKPDGTQYGGIVNFRGRKVLVPASIKANDFEPIMKGLTPDQLVKGSAYGGPPTRADGSQFQGGLRNAYLVSIGDGRYVVSVSDPDAGEPQLLRDPRAPASTGHAYVLDLHKVLPWMQRGRK